LDCARHDRLFVGPFARATARPFPEVSCHSERGLHQAARLIDVREGWPGPAEINRAFKKSSRGQRGHAGHVARSSSLFLPGVFTCANPGFSACYGNFPVVAAPWSHRCACLNIQAN
jgi:hypothetical protein